MGYRTRYELTATPDIQEIWDAVKENETLNFSVGFESENSKWYDHEADMVEFSKKFPNVTFLLHGEGEDNGDIWDKHFRNGKKQICRASIIIPPMREDSWI